MMNDVPISPIVIENVKILQEPKIQNNSHLDPNLFLLIKVKLSNLGLHSNKPPLSWMPDDSIQNTRPPTK